MRVRAKGGSGGTGTVQTDGVTIQGDGSAGNKIAIKAVQVQARLTGAGTVASPLDVNGWPLTAFYQGSVRSNTTPTANQVWVIGFYLPCPLTFAHIGWNIETSDNTGLYDVGIYSGGSLIANIGAQTMPTAFSFYKAATLQGAQTIYPGLYSFAFTGNAAVATLGYDGNAAGWVYNQGAGASVGGTLPASITAPTVNPTGNGACFMLY